MTDSRFYVYELIDPRNNQPFYVGKGTGYRMASHLTEAKQPKIKWTNAIKCERINSIWQQGYDVKLHKVAQYLSEEDAFILEDNLINQYGLLVNNTGILTNIFSSSSFPRTGNIKRQTRQVVQYSMTGDVIYVFESASAAAVFTNIRISGILGCCKGKMNHAGNFRWSFEGDSLLPLRVCSYHTSRRKPVAQYTLDNQLINKFPSVRMAAQATTINAANIVACCSKYKHTKTAGGFYWRYIDDSNS